MKANTYAQMKVLETKNCVLRPALIDDANDMFEYYSQHKVVKYLPLKKHNTVNDTKRFIRIFFLKSYDKGNVGHYAVVYKENGKVIGNVGFNNIAPSSKEGEIGICISPSYWGMNLSEELCIKILELGFKDLDLDKIIAMTYEENNYSRKPLEKIGFTYIGSYRKLDKLNSSHEIIYHKYEMSKDYYFEILIKALNIKKTKHKKRNDRFGKSK